MIYYFWRNIFDVHPMIHPPPSIFTVDLLQLLQCRADLQCPAVAVDWSRKVLDVLESFSFNCITCSCLSVIGR